MLPPPSFLPPFPPSSSRCRRTECRLCGNIMSGCSPAHRTQRSPRTAPLRSVLSPSAFVRAGPGPAAAPRRSAPSRRLLSNGGCDPLRPAAARHHLPPRRRLPGPGGPTAVSAPAAIRAVRGAELLSPPPSSFPPSHPPAVMLCPFPPPPPSSPLRPRCRSGGQTPLRGTLPGSGVCAGTESPAPAAGAPRASWEQRKAQSGGDLKDRPVLPPPPPQLRLPTAGHCIGHLQGWAPTALGSNAGASSPLGR